MEDFLPVSVSLISEQNRSRRQTGSKGLAEISEAGEQVQLHDGLRGHRLNDNRRGYTTNGEWNGGGERQQNGSSYIVWQTVATAVITASTSTISKCTTVTYKYSLRTPEVTDSILDNPFLHKMWIKTSQLYTESSLNASITFIPTQQEAK